jgi:uncharacterized protein with von Willebrand factor type A (vWA) domain
MATSHGDATTSIEPRLYARRYCPFNFSTGINVLKLGKDVGLEAVLRFLQMSFPGGTDVAPALEHALDKMVEEAYRNADLLVVSEFIMSALPERTLARIDG